MGLVGETFYSGFPLAHDTYNALSKVEDGRIFYVLCSDQKTIGGRLYSFDPLDDSIEEIGDLSIFCGESESGAISQGKSHVPFFEINGVLYFGTHVGYYEEIDGMERLPQDTSDGVRLYLGGHFLSYDLQAGVVQDLGLVPHGEGILAMACDVERRRLYAITWPVGHFVSLDIDRGDIHDHGPIAGAGESGKVGSDYRVLCRSPFVEPESGRVYFTVAEGDIHYYDPAQNQLCKFTEAHMRLDYFGQYSVEDPGSMAYNWRKIFWHPIENVAYGVHGNSGYLFRFDPKQGDLKIIQRLTSALSQQSGMFDQFSYGYLGFDLGPDLETIYYLTGGPIFEEGRRLEGASTIAKGGAKGLENLHLVTYHLPSRHYIDHGPIFYENGGRPTYVNSIAVGDNGDVFTLARMEHEGRVIQDLVRIRNPFS
ncbi:MAG: hypothetical protein HKN87_10070 [Saprospiraceae bacterium]|nr:hypothetical protein [Saprospiraceae bacterium]